MAKVRSFCDVARNYSEIADFVLVYIEEAHATDGWGFLSNPHQIKRHRNLEERIDAAKFLMTLVDIPCEVVVDEISNRACKEYGALPDRLYIVQRNIIVYQGKFGPTHYNVDAVAEWLTQTSQ